MALLGCTVLLLACTHDFDAFRPIIDNVGTDTRPDDVGGGDDTRDAASGDTRDTGPADTRVDVGCGDMSMCLDADVACGNDCGTTLAGCLGGCGGDGLCEANCRKDAGTCRNKCSKTCTTCAKAAGCDGTTECMKKAGL